MKIAAGAAIALACLCLPAAAAAGIPSLDQYAVPAPSAKGDQPAGANPVAQPADLPQPVREALAKSPDAATLTLLATARELGAPATAASGSADQPGDEDRSVPGAVASTLGSPGSLLLVAALLAIAALGVLGYRNRQNRQPGS
jgi:hypothetical protein